MAQYNYAYPAVFWINGIRTAGKQIAIMKQPSGENVERNGNSVAAQWQISHTDVALVANRNVFAIAFKWRSVADFARHQSNSVMCRYIEVRVNNNVSAFDFQRKRYVRHIS